MSYAIRTGKYRVRGFQGITLSRPLHSVGTVVGNVVSHFESRAFSDDPRRMAHLIAVARK